MQPPKRTHIDFCLSMRCSNTMTGHEAYSFLEKYYGYHYIFIIIKDKYKTIFITNWGAFVWQVIPFGVKNGLPTYQ